MHPPAPPAPALSRTLPRHTAMLISPWLLAGSTLILALAIAFWAYKNAQQERESMAANLQARAGALMWAVEGSARAGMGMMRTAAYMQYMLEEISRQPDIKYIAVISPEGEILAHSDPARIGQTLYQGRSLEEILPYQQVHWRVMRGYEGSATFEAYRRFIPLPGFTHRPGHGRRGHGGMPMMRGRHYDRMPPPGAAAPPPWPPPGIPGLPAPPPGTPGLPAPPPPGFGPVPRQESGPPPYALSGNEPVIVIGLDMSSLESHLTTAERNTVFTALLVCLLGVGAFLSLFWAQNYKMSRRMLMDARAFTDEVVGSMPLGLVILDASGKVAQANALAGKLLGRPPASLAGLSPDELPGFNWRGLAERASRGEAVLEEEYDLARSAAPLESPAARDNATGQDLAPPEAEVAPMPVSVSASRIVNEVGESLGVLFLLRDIREVKRLQTELRKSERLSTLGNMAARVAHEIRNPLSSIKGFATFLGTRQREDTEREAARTMIGEVDRLNRVVSELLDFARPSNLQLAPVRVEEIMERAVRLARMDADTRGVNLRLENPPGHAPLPPIQADAERLTQALLNLLLNAVQATDAGGGVTLSALPGAHGVNLRVADSGRGMDAKVLSQVFNPYFTTRATGTGLGLSIVAKIVEDHQGKISMTSTPGRGTTVTVRLPAAGQSPAYHP